MAVGAAPPGTRRQIDAKRWAAGLGTVATAGLVLMVLATVKAEATPVVDEQVGWAALGLSGAAAVGLAALSGVTMARRAIRERLHGVIGGLAAALPARPTGWGEVPPDGLFLTAGNMRHYHRPDCQLVQGKGARSAPEEEHRKAGLSPCAVCA